MHTGTLTNTKQKRTMRIILTLITLMCLMSCSKKAQINDEYKNSDNLLHAIDIINENDQKGLELLEKEVDEHPKNGYAWLWIAGYYYNHDYMGRALEDVNLAIKYLDGDNKELSRAYGLRSEIYLVLNENNLALKDMNTMIELCPENAEGYNKRALYYYVHDQYELSDADYREVVILKSGNPTGYIGLGRNALETGNIEEALKMFNYSIGLDPDCAQAYSLRSEVYRMKGKYAEATDDILKCLEMGYNGNYVFDQIRKLAETAYDVLDMKLKAKHVKDPKYNNWYALHGAIAEDTKHYQEAIEYYQKIEDDKPYPDALVRIARCYRGLRNWHNAIKYICWAYSKDTTQYDMLTFRAEVEEEAGMYRKALEDFDKYIQNVPDDSNGYYNRAWLKDHLRGDYKGAIDDYTTAITLEPHEPIYHMMRAYCYQRMGDNVSAQADWTHIVENDAEEWYDNAKMYALYWTGHTDEAINYLDEMLKTSNEVNRAMLLYDACCLYSLMGDTDRALEYLQQSLDEGYDEYMHIIKDWDMDNLRNLPRFKEIMQKHFSYN